MPKKFGAGRLNELVAFDKRQQADDGYGNEIAGDFQEQFRHPAEFIHLKGGSETVMQARLDSHPSVIMRVRKCAQTQQIEVDWQARDVRRGTAYNVRSITEDPSRALLDILAEANVNPG